MSKHQFLDPAVKIVRQAGQRIKKAISSSRVQAVKGSDDLVTDGDLLAETMILDFLKRKFPTHGFDSEERGVYNPGADFIWILDPIDGTKYYARGLPLYAISLALKYKQQNILGIVYLPETEQLFCAEQGKGAGMNGKRITCSSRERLQDCILCLEIPPHYSSPGRQEWALRILERLAKRTQRTRIIGVGSIGLCFTAMAGFDIYLNLSDTWKVCDIAAGCCILEEAGGKFAEKNGALYGAPERLLSQLEEIIRGSND